MEVRIIISSGLFTILITILGDYIAGFLKVPTPTPALTLLWIAGLFYVILKYRMLEISPYTVTMEILNSIDDIVVLFNPDGSINWFNKTGDAFFYKVLSEEPHLLDLFGHKHQENSLVDDIMQDRRQIARFRFPFRLGSMTTVYDVVLEQVKDSFDDNMGYLMRVNRVKSINSLQIFYKLTKREG
jgi:hypothetical protein